MFLIGYDIGSSSVKAALVDAKGNKAIHTVKYPEKEMSIHAENPGWAEQDPEKWWEYLAQATAQLLREANISGDTIQAIGISYQMHGLVIVDKQQQVLRPSIIWCDSRAIELGDKAFHDLGNTYCWNHLLNSPGNFTASKLRWVQLHEPKIYEQIYKVMLPGDYVAMKMSGQINTTISGLSEGIFWDFQKHQIAESLMEYYGFDPSFIPEIVDTFSIQGYLTQSAASFLGLKPNIPLTYRAGDQANNALSLQVFEPGEIAATGGTSGVVYGISDQLAFDEASRINSFAHVNHRKDDIRIGQLLCINGAGSLYSWVNHQIAEAGISYAEMEGKASDIPVGSDGLVVLPFGNGAERMLKNQDLGAEIIHIQFNVHKQAHMYRAALEGIAFAFVYGIDILKTLGVNPQKMKAGNDNLFQSKIFSQTVSNLVGCEIEIIETTGAIGAAQASGVGIGIYSSPKEAIQEVRKIKSITPDETLEQHQQAFANWKKALQSKIIEK